MAWCRPGEKPLSEPMIIILLTHIASLGLNKLINHGHAEFILKNKSKFIFILYHFIMLVLLWEFKFVLMKDNDSLVLHNQYHVCWWMGNARSQGISSYGIYLHFLEYSSLIHWGQNKIAISQVIFSNAHSWMKIYEFNLRFHWSLFLRFELTIFHHWFR